MNRDELTDNLLLARAAGRSFFRQVLDIARHALRRRGVAAADYYYYALYDDNLWTDEERERVLGDAWFPVVVRKTARPDWWAVAQDKVLQYLLLQSYGFPVPRVTAIYHPTRRYPGATHLADRTALEDWLRHACRYPQFAKPASGIQSRGQALLEAYDPDSDTLRRRGDDPIAVDAFVDQVLRQDGVTGDDGFLFQDLLEPDPALEPLVGPRLTGIRVIVILTETGPKILHALWKIPSGENFADNYWRPGNLIAELDRDTGEVKTMCSGWGADRQELTRHPDTDAVLIGQRPPGWEAVRDLALRASVTLPKILFQGWDIGLTKGGPTVIEVNLGSSFRLSQIVERRGFLDPEFERFLEWAEAKIDAERVGAFG